MRSQRQYRMLEKTVVVVVTLGSMWAIYDKLGIFYVSNRAIELHKLVAIVAGSLLGFTLTTTTVALNIQSFPRLDRVRSSENYMEMWNTFFRTMRTLGLLTLISIICLMHYKPTSLNRWLELPLFPLIGLAVLRMIRIIWILQRLVQIIAKPSAAGGLADISGE